MSYERGPLTSDEIEEFIWFHLCKAYNEREEDGVDFQQLFDEGDDEIPEREELKEAAEYLETQGHLKKEIGEDEFWLGLTNFGKKKCEGIDVSSSWSV